ncbi:MAG TPA: hypothetical protein VGU68_19955, partial [Ktedonobacteraceae bacterium]|nr:hypothetical protein [Ktedonobacteraceae bacterium]
MVNRHMSNIFVKLDVPSSSTTYRVPDTVPVGTGVVRMWCGGAYAVLAPCPFPTRSVVEPYWAALLPLFIPAAAARLIPAAAD